MTTITTYRPKPGSNVEKIFEYVKSNPGVGTSAIASEMGLPWRAAQTTTNRLIQRGYLEDRVDDRGHHHFYALEVMVVEPDSEPRLSDSAAELLATVAENPGIGYAQLADAGYGARTGPHIGTLLGRDLISVRLGEDGKRGLYEAGKFDHLDEASKWPWPATLAGDFLDYIQNNPGTRVAPALESIDPAGSASAADRVLDMLITKEFIRNTYDSDGHRTFQSTGKV